MNEEKGCYTAEDFYADITLIEEVFCGKDKFLCPVCGTSSRNGSWELVRENECLLIVKVSHEVVLDGGGGKAEHLLLWVGSNGNTSLHDDLKKKHAKRFKAYDYITF